MSGGAKARCRGPMQAIGRGSLARGHGVVAQLAAAAAVAGSAQQVTKLKGGYRIWPMHAVNQGCSGAIV
jgi:hypothetical protein